MTNKNYKVISYSEEARTKLKAGVKKLADAVSITLGPKGRNAIIALEGQVPTTTKDGVSVARQVKLQDVEENVGAQIVAEAAIKTSTEAGDGTTTATILAHAIYENGLRLVNNASVNPVDLGKGMIIAKERVDNYLNSKKQNVENQKEIENIATISANNDPVIGNLIAKAVEKVGRDGVITVEEGKGMETSVEFADGMQYDKGYLSNYFVTDQKTMVAELMKPAIIITEKKLSSFRDIVSILEPLAMQAMPVLIIADDVDGECLPMLIVNKMKGLMSICAVKAPSYGQRRKEILQDIAVFTGGKVINDENLGELKIENIGNPMMMNQTAQTGMMIKSDVNDWVGKANKVTITKDSFTIIEGQGNDAAITERIEELKSQVNSIENDFDKQKMQERIAKFTGGVAIIRVGAPTEIQAKETKDRVDDAVAATKASLEDGVIVGGGISLLHAGNNLDSEISSISFENKDQRAGYEIVRNSLTQPIRIIIQNAGKNPDLIIEKIVTQANGNTNYGWNARTETFEDLFVGGVLDPTKVEKCALTNAISVASNMLLCETALVEINEKQEPTMDPSQMGMM